MPIYLTRKLRRDTLKEIGEQFEIFNESTVSSVIERMKKKLAGDRKFALRLDQLTELTQKAKSGLDPFTANDFGMYGMNGKSRNSVCL